MKSDDPKYALSEVPEAVHAVISSKAARQTGTAKHTSRPARRPAVRILAAAACLGVITTAALAVNGLYHMHLNKQGTYGADIVLQTDAEQGSQLPAQVHELELTSGYIPDGMVRAEEGVKLCYSDSMYRGGITITTVLMSGSNLSAALTDTDIAENEEGTLPVYHVGDTLTLPSAYCEDTDGNFVLTDAVTVTVDDVQITDDLSPLGSAQLPEEWADVLGENGKPVPDHLYYIRSGGGINSADEIVAEGTDARKLVYVTVTYTNAGDSALSHLLCIGNLMTLARQNDGTYAVIDRLNTHGDDYDRIETDGAAHSAEMARHSVSDDYGDGGNYIPSLQPGESVQIGMAWIVDESDLPYLYPNRCPDGSVWELSGSVSATGVVSLNG